MSVYTPERRERLRQIATNYVRVVDPTEQEIAERCAEIRATWTSRERRYRLPPTARWTVPELCCVDYSEG